MSFHIQLARKSVSNPTAEGAGLASVFLPPKVVPTIEGSFAVDSQQELDALVESLVGAGKAYWPSACRRCSTMACHCAPAEKALREQQRVAGG